MSIDSLAALSFQIDYFDGSKAQVRNSTLNYLVGNGDFTYVGSVSGSAFVPKDRNGNSLNAIVVQPGYFLKSAAQEQATLVHELLHVYENKDDKNLRNFLKLDPADTEPSPQITEWLMQDCKR